MNEWDQVAQVPQKRAESTLNPFSVLTGEKGL